MKYGFVILHYMAEEMTKECVDKLLSLFKGQDIFVVIVDNASSNGSGKNLESYYQNSAEVKVILSEENSGFAKGNNLGFDYLKQNYNSDFMIVMNNDVIISDSDFLKKINDIHEKKGYDVLAPDIYNPKLNKHQNPFFLKGANKEEVIANNAMYTEQLKSFDSYYKKMVRRDNIRFNPVLRAVYDFLKYTVLRKKRRYQTEYVNPVPHGSCVIFSKHFIEAREYAFNPCTFLYYEENILHYECMRDNLKILYCPDISVVHLEDVSTGKVYKDDYKKEKFKLEQMIKSSSAFIDIME